MAIINESTDRISGVGHNPIDTTAAAPASAGVADTGAAAITAAFSGAAAATAAAATTAALAGAGAATAALAGAADASAADAVVTTTNATTDAGPGAAWCNHARRRIATLHTGVRSFATNHMATSSEQAVSGQVGG